MDLTCHFKKSFETQKEAEKRLKAIQKIKDGKQKPVRAYKCGTCNLFHLTSKR